MEKLPNLKIVANEIEYDHPPVIGDIVIGFAKRTDERKNENENIVSFVVKEMQQKILIEVEKQNLKPFAESSAKELEIGHFAIIVGQFSDEGLIFTKECEQMQVLKAESVYFMKVEEQPDITRVLLEIISERHEMNKILDDVLESVVNRKEEGNEN